MALNDNLRSGCNMQYKSVVWFKCVANFVQSEKFKKIKNWYIATPFLTDASKGQKQKISAFCQTAPLCKNAETFLREPKIVS